MKWLKNNKDAPSNGYWDTISDIMSTLLLVLLLVIVLLILYVVRAPDYTSLENTPESEITVEDGTDAQYIERDAGNKVVKDDVPYLYSADLEDEYGQGELTGDYEFEEGGFEDGEFDGHEGAAVKVIVEDSETNSPIKEAGITFSLYTSAGRRTRLYSYYPSRTAWIQFTTDEAGSFFLPQKLIVADYMLHQLTVPAGYEMAEDVPITLDKPYSWSDPYVVHIPLKSVRNTIHLTAVDSVTSTPVAGSVFDILAAEDIKTKDGTVRYPAGSVVDQITCDENGEGRSAALYMGSYTVQQSGAPEYYAVSKNTYDVVLSADENAEAAVEQQVLCEKTRYTIHVVDELYRSVAVPGAEFVLRDEKGTETVQTAGEDGTISLEALDKDTAYTLTQTTTAEGYSFTADKLSFYVDENGRIYDEVAFEDQLTNRTLRLAVYIQDALFKNAASGCRVELYNANGQLVNSWYSSDVVTTVEGMPAGQYRLSISGNGSSSVTVQIDDIAQVQTVNCSVWTTANKLVVGCSGVGVTSVGAATGLIISRRKKKKNQADT